MFQAPICDKTLCNFVISLLLIFSLFLSLARSRFLFFCFLLFFMLSVQLISSGLFPLFFVSNGKKLIWLYKDVCIYLSSSCTASTGNKNQIKSKQRLNCRFRKIEITQLHSTHKNTTEILTLTRTKNDKIVGYKSRIRDSNERSATLNFWLLHLLNRLMHEYTHTQTHTHRNFPT